MIDRDHQITFTINLELLGTFETEFHGARIRMRRDYKIVLELLLVAVIDHIDAGIDALVVNLAVDGHVCVPVAWVIAYQVINFSFQFVLALDGRSRVSADHLQTQDRTLVR